VQIHYDLDNFKALNPVVTIGTFDGVHLGHREVINELKRLCNLSGGESVVVTFEPHPRIIISPDEDSLRLLSTKSEKIKLIEKIGIDHLILYPFTRMFSKMSYNEFVAKILVSKLHISSLVVGYDHRFGKGRKGDFNSLEILSKLLTFKVERLSGLIVDDEVVSSTKIRLALGAGDISKAKLFLGYQYTISGRVIGGKQLGRKIGFPTANIEAEDPYKLVPGDGVYAVKVDTGETTYNGMVNIGVRPTVDYNADKKSIEVHIFNFDKDIYNSEIVLHFVKKIRNEKKFSDIDQLQQQLVRDRIIALNILSDENLKLL
jgi:riboflavin kinase/FMN adenylyltransferase